MSASSSLPAFFVIALAGVAALVSLLNGRLFCRIGLHRWRLAYSTKYDRVIICDCCGIERQTDRGKTKTDDDRQP